MAPIELAVVTHAKKTLGPIVVEVAGAMTLARQFGSGADASVVVSGADSHLFAVLRGAGVFSAKVRRINL